MREAHTRASCAGTQSQGVRDGCDSVPPHSRKPRPALAPAGAGRGVLGDHLREVHLAVSRDNRNNPGGTGEQGRAGQRA